MPSSPERTTHLRTVAAHAGHSRPEVPTSPASPPIYQASVFEFADLAQVDAVQSGAAPGFIYSRMANPTCAALEADVARLEGAEAALAVASGMGAIFAVLFGLVSAGDHVVAGDELYGGSYAVLARELRRFGVEATFVDATDPAAVAAAMRPNTRVCYVETITNPTMQVVDIPALAAVCRPRGVRLIVDNTFATPIHCRPLRLGADAVIHSATKFLGGHSDVTAGVVAGGPELIAAARGAATLTGATLDPFAAWLVVRGIKTLAVRVERQSATALELARRLAAHPRVERVCYPGLDGAGPAARVLSGGFGPMLAFEVAPGPGEADDGLAAADRVLTRLRLIRITPSLGGATTTSSHPVLTSHRAMPPEERARLGIRAGLIRLSVGVEDVEDVWSDLQAALAG